MRQLRCGITPIHQLDNGKVWNYIEIGNKSIGGLLSGSLTTSRLWELEIFEMEEVEL
jgi:hypothetical protein